MQNIILASARIFTGRRLMCVAAILALVCGFVPIVQAQNGVNPLTLFKNYFVTGDYVVGGVGLRGEGVGGFATGTISIPDAVQTKATGVASSSVPPGAEIVAAFLYWETIEASKTQFAGQNGFFNGYAISGKVLGNANAPDTWSRGGCSGAAKAPKTMRTYRADVRPYLPLDASGKVQGNGHFLVKLADSGSNGAVPPLTLGASLVIIYRLLSPAVPLNSIILYDGSYSPTNDALVTTQTIDGFYQASQGPVAKITEIVGNGHPKKQETVNFNGIKLPSPYGALPPFPGVYNRSWDNPTWLPNNYGAAVNFNDSAETTTVVPADRDGDDDDEDPSKGCVNWGATVFSTTVQDTDHDGLLDVWEANQGYTDVNTGEWVALPGANPNVSDIFVQLDYLNALLPVSPQSHSHLPQQGTLDAVGLAYKNHGINLHVDIGPTVGTVFAGDPYVIPYPLPVGPGATPPPAGTGGHGIVESSVVCTDAPPALCEFPGDAAISWKTGFENVKSQNFWPGRKDSYRYILFGHSLGMPTSTWSATGEVVPNTLNGTLVSIVDVGTTATVTIQNPTPDPVPTNATRVTVVGALNQFALNGTYSPISVTGSSMSGGITTTTFTITTTGVANGTYNFLNEPQLAVAIGGPNSTSGFSDYGGADTLITLGLWPNFDPGTCQPDPSKALLALQVYCANQVGTLGVQTGTLLHEMGHPLTLTHGGTYYPSGTVGPMGQQINNPIGLPTYGENCKSNFLSAMNYLFQIFGFPDGGAIDYSGQTLQDLSEISLNETSGLGLDVFNSSKPAHLTRWYAPPDAADMAIQTAFGHHYASAHCDGSQNTAGTAMVKIDNSATPAPAIDWNHSGSIDAGSVGPQDINFNGVVGDPTFHGFNDWVNLNLAQIGARRNVAGFSGGVTGADIFGGGADIFGGGADIFGGGADIFGGGADIFGGGADVFGGGAGFEIDFTIASTTVDPPSGLQCTNCAPTTGITTETASLSVPLSWTPPGFGVIQQYAVLRAEGSFPTLKDVAGHIGSFFQVGVTTSVGGTPAATSFVDSNSEGNPNNVVNGKTYTYFISDTNSANVNSGPSSPLVVTVAVPPSGLNGVVTNTNEGESIGVALSWTQATPSLPSQFTVWRATGSCATLSGCPLTFAPIGTPTPSTIFQDNQIPATNTYTYYITESFPPGPVQTGPSTPLVIYVNCNADNDGDNDCHGGGLLSVMRPPSILLRGSPAKGSILADDSLRTSLGLEDLLP